ncbi:Alpha crystallin/Hsp20 domain [Dillenia turbinata]|uniref:Alpha crystallin/Hsp20 domain n=1 Tax=Dillenia turbinata TaxID=194707 RepID=A0AAN8YY13_9MAGN
MEFPTLQPSPWNFLLSSPLLFPYQFLPENYVHWTETPESHIYTADLPGARKEEIKVELEDSKYLIIRTEAMDESTKPAIQFMRKFRLPDRVDVDGISAGYEYGVLTVTVPRSFVRRGFYIDPADLPNRLDLLSGASAA